jgi:very-short-patch-repair endonuclease
MSCLVLLRNKVKIKHQYKIGKYKVDFVLIEYNVVLEIDGELYHNKKTEKRDKERDAEILKILGNEWQVIRISTEYINQNAKMLFAAIKKVMHQREKFKK